MSFSPLPEYQKMPPLPLRVPKFEPYKLAEADVPLDIPAFLKEKPLQSDNEPERSANFEPTPWSRIMMLNEAGNVTRLHTVTTHKVWSIGRHVYGAQVVAMELCDINQLDPGLCLEWLLYHDCEELYTGDVPAPTKRRKPEVRDALVEMERDFRTRWRIPKLQQHLIKQGRGHRELMNIEVAICKASDALDLGVCVLQERMLGNRHPVLERVLDNVADYTLEHVWVPGVNQLRSELCEAWHKVRSV